MRVHPAFVQNQAAGWLACLLVLLPCLTLCPDYGTESGSWWLACLLLLLAMFNALYMLRYRIRQLDGWPVCWYFCHVHTWWVIDCNISSSSPPYKRQVCELYCHACRPAGMAAFRMLTWWALPLPCWALWVQNLAASLAGLFAALHPSF